jgi:putative photosynthetic complex assembly protein
MSQAAQSQPSRPQIGGFPRGVLLGAGALIAFAFSITLFSRTSDIGALHMPKAQAYQVLHLDFVDGDDGSVAILDASDGALIYTVAPGTNGFVRSAVRGFAHERRRDGIGPAQPFTLTRWTDGTLSLQDEATGRRIDLDAFGPTQAESFARLFQAREKVK